MPTTAEVAWAKFRVVVLIGCALIIVSVLVYLLLGGSDIFQPAVTIRTYMTDLSGLARKSPVRFNGIRVGAVTETALSGLRDPQRVVRVDMSIMNRYLRAIPEDSTVVVSADTVIGDKFADVNEGKSPRHLEPNAVLVTPPPKANSNADLIKAGRQILAEMDVAISDIEAGRGELGQFIKGEAVYDQALNKVLALQKEIRAAAGKESRAGRLIYDDTLYRQIEAPVNRLDNALAQLQAGQGAGGKLLKDSARYDQLRKSIGDLDRSLADLNAGKGQAGKLVKDDELYTRINQVVDKLTGQVDALNAGQGTLGQLMISNDLYENLQGSMKNLQGVLRELRENPRKYLRLKVF
jgi:phospholipid/cholesterol/gamma-HCH transport system substrate-binding protein